MAAQVNRPHNSGDTVKVATGMSRGSDSLK